MTALALAALITFSPLADAVPADPERGAWPAYVDVFRRHARGSSVPARVERVPFPLYVERVLQSGALPPDRPMEALRAMAVTVATRATWLVRHRDPRMRWHGRAFDVTDGSRPAWCGRCDHGMFYRAVKVHSRIRRAVADVRGMVLRRPNGNLRKPQWSGRSGPCGTGVTGNRLPAMGAVSCVRRGYSWRRVLRVYFPKGTVG
jgi:hypothetical protein